MRFGLVEELFGSNTPTGTIRSLAPALGELFGEEVSLVLASSYAALTQRFVHGEIDVAWLAPAVLVEAARSGAVGRIVAAVRRGALVYGAALVVRDEGGPRALAQLSHTRAGWVDPWSAAGYLFPRRMLRRAGLDPAAIFTEQRFYGHHAAVLDAVAGGEVDVGAVFCGLESDAAEPADPRLRVLARTEAIPGDALCLSARFEATHAARVVERLCSERARTVAGMLQAERFVERAIEDYQPVREALEDEWGRSSRDS